MSPLLTDFALLCLTSLFTMINPFSVAPVYLSLTMGFNQSQRRRVANKATVTAFFILVFFALSGSLIFKLFGISVDGLKIVGGILLFLTGFDMVQARLSRTRFDKPEDMQVIDAYSQDVALTPLAIPLISGPGAIATVIILIHDGDAAHQGVLFASIALVCLVTWLSLLFADPLMRRLGDGGNKVLMRIMGLIVMMIAVEYFFSGLRPIMRSMLNIAVS